MLSPLWNPLLRRICKIWQLPVFCYCFVSKWGKFKSNYFMIMYCLWIFLRFFPSVFILFNCEFKKSLDSIVQKTMTVHYFCGQLILKVITSEGIFNLSLNFSTLDLPQNSLHFLCVKQGMYVHNGNTGCGVFKGGIPKLIRFLAKNQL